MSEFQYWTNLKLTKPRFEDKKYFIDITSSQIKSPPLRVDSVNEKYTVFQFNRSFQGFYLEIKYLYDQITNLLYSNRFDIFKLDIPKERISHLLVSSLEFPNSLNEMPKLKILNNKFIFEVDKVYNLNLTFSRLKLTPTDITLDLTIQNMEIENLKLNDSDQEPDINDSEYE